ncbi:MAG TPA: alpha-L-rhamnosidase C-terminal domain-containing protein [Bryobacteraceae bacterium]
MRLFALALILTAAVFGADAESWTARWIAVPGAAPHAYGVYHFRRAFRLAAKPASFRVRVSADQRYQFFVNGKRAGLGPARGDLTHWRYESYDIAPLLAAGENVLAAVVWNAGSDSPVAQNTNETGFLLAGETEAERAVETGESWKCIRDEAYAPEPGADKVRGYFALGSGDRVDASRYPWGWEQPGYDDSGWKQAAAGTAGAPRDSANSPNRWMLVPRSIPMPESGLEQPMRIRSGRGLASAPPPSGVGPLTIPAGSSATLLLDNERLTTAYPELILSGGKGSSVRVGYAEALYVPGTERKEDRNEIAGKEFVGYQDVWLPDGGARRLFRPLWWRTYRYIQITIQTGDAPLTIDDLRGIYTGYPFVRKARFEGGTEEIRRILDTGWRTARLCAHETYMDCPYYEQLQYAGDTRIQALVSLYMSGDGRLMRNAIEQLNSSRTAEGATYSRAPSHLQQYIPPFSLWWIGILHDYWMYQDDPVFVRSMLPGVRAVLSFFAARQKPGGSLGHVPWWNFVDWTKEWKEGVPPAEPDGSSAPLDLQLLLAYQWAAQLEGALGSKALAGEYEASAAELRATINNLYWDAGRRMFADTPRKADYSQHAQTLAVLAGVIAGKDAADLIDRAARDATLVQCSIYFRYYLHSALAAAGYGDRYLDLLDEWRGQLSRGLTTWAESYEPSRSDCHAWGASPNIELFRTVLGIDTAAPGFRRVIVRPALGKLTRVAGAVPHPKGEIAVSYALSGGKLEATVTLPAGVEGDFVWKGERRPLPAGTSKLVF